ncbi:hypothetical protein D2V17_05425 [Aurantiacibacter xanthus]|uniref:Uncharacterized protein n=1 Tax=Aurantiacibacter xanthus TaxID=1784712 RepID=A0A3A1P738_9SPHN|nr:hypothetical protein [Aurantiacibacter xanthus]RIV89712.1 hypothetical protein D2V17_05425 [Aurantiacibacter xanthus]
MTPRAKRFPTHHGYGEVKVSRYLALFLVLLGWSALGVYLCSTALWPSACTPDDLFEVYACSMHLPESGHWREAALLTWLWGTPIMTVLELSRRLGRPKI